MTKRMPAVAGYFYPARPKELESEIDQLMPKTGNINAFGAICPHAGYVFSGAVAGAVYSLMKPKEVYILFGPNHTGYGASVSLMKEGEWQIPLGSLKIESTLADKILKKTDLVRADESAHIHEHSLEVQLPFIYRANPQAKIVPIVFKMIDLIQCRNIAQAIADSVVELNLTEKVVIISSTDMSHYLPDDLTRKIDSLATEKIKNFDPEGLYETVLEYKISMCGIIPTVTMLYATKLLGAREVRIVKYATSGEVNRDYSKVVGYLGALVL